MDGESPVGTPPPRRAPRRNRRMHRSPRRSRSVFIALAEDEYAILADVAEREHLAVGAYAAKAALSAAQGATHPEYLVLREALGGVMHAAGQVRRIGVNLNQAVAALNSGEESEQLRWYAEATARTVARLDDLADQIKARLP